MNNDMNPAELFYPSVTYYRRRNMLLVTEKNHACILSTYSHGITYKGPHIEDVGAL